MLLELFQIIFFSIGLIAIFSVISGLFFAYDKGPKNITTNNPLPEVGSPEFLTTLSYTVNSPIESGGTIQPLHNGDGFFPVLLNDIKQAKQNINFTVYIWEAGKASDQILKALIEKQKEGVQVRILIDYVGGTWAPTRRFKELTDVGGKVVKFRTLAFGKLTTFHRRTHRRSIVIDGQVGFTGGMSVKDVWLGNAKDSSQWRDMMFRVTGTMARNLQSAFTALWTSSTGEILLGNGIYSSDVPAEKNDIKFIHLVSSPNDSLPLTKFILLSIMAAKEKLFITTPYFIPDRHMLKALKERVKAGVDVRIMLPNHLIDNKFVRWNAQNFYHELLEEGVRIFEYQPTFLHTKYTVIDGKWSLIGSANQNYRSRNLDEENTFGIQDTKLAQQLEATFAEDAKLCKEITVKTWRKRSALFKLIIAFSRILEEQS